MKYIERLLAIAPADSYLDANDTILFIFLSRKDGLDFEKELRSIKEKTLTIRKVGFGSCELSIWNIDSNENFFIHKFPIDDGFWEETKNLEQPFYIEFRVFKDTGFHPERICKIESSEFNFISINLS